MSNAVATIERAPRSVLVDMSSRYGMEPAAFEATVRATVTPANTSREEFAAFLLVAKEYSLNPLTKEIYAFPKRGGGIVPIVSIDGWVSLVNSHPACDGFEFDMEHDKDGNLIACTCRMFRKDRSRPVTVTEYLDECIRATDPWKMKHRMLRHKAMIQAARYAFGFSGIYDEDEGAKIAEAREPRDITPPPAPAALVPPSAPKTASVPTHRETRNNAASEIDPDLFLDGLSKALGSAATMDDLAEIWAADAEPAINSGDLLAPDIEEANALYEKHRARIED